MAITLIPKPDKAIIKKKYRPVSFMDIDVKLLNKTQMNPATYKKYCTPLLNVINSRNLRLVYYLKVN